MIPRPGQGLSATPSTAGGSTSRSSTPTGHDGDARNRSASGATGPVDHTTSHTYGQSLRSYPPDCPPANVVWFHAVDVAKRKLQLQASSRRAKGTTSASAATTTTVAGAASDDSKAAKPPQPKKFVAFEPQDCQAIESAYQRWLEAKEDERARSASDRRNRSASDVNGEPNVRVPVHEDYLFEVDIAERELRPVYWLGPTYEVRRGSWFYQEGSTLRPCDENLAGQLETGYLKVQPWKYPPPPPRRGASTATPAKDATKDATPKASVENLKGAAEAQPSPTQQHQPGTYRLFGPYSNTIATYQDATTVWLTSESVLSWVTSTMYERFVGGAYMSGVKLVRGYTEQKKGAAEDKRPSTPPPTSARDGLQPDEKQQRMLKRRSAPPTTKADAAEGTASASSRGQQEPRQSRLTRQLSTMLESGDSKEEQIRKQEEQAMEDDYNTAEGEKQGREIEHLVLVTHGIGQLLGLKMENINFVHDVNTLRKTLKTVYANSPDLKALNGELGSGRGNCRIQVLPVCWRHLVDFPRRRHEVRPREHDLGETADQDDADEYPSLEDITIEGMAFARSLISDLALDVLLYQSAYREQISHIVRDESNRIYKLFVERNPGFKGKVHIIGHSLGSAIMFDILCRQKERPKPAQQKWRNPLSFWPSREDVQQTPPQDPRDLTFDFDVHDFYCLGSPVGLFQMLKGR